MASINPFLGASSNFSSSYVKFSHLISVKLDEKNLKQCKQKIDGVIRGHKLQKFITEPLALLQFLTESDRTANRLNPLFLEWEQQDALVCTWILSTISDSIRTKLVDYHYLWQVWEEIHRHFCTLLATKASQLRSELRSLTKGDRKIDEFIIRVRTINESLISIGDPVPHRNLIEIVLEALPEEYDSVVAAVCYEQRRSVLVGRTQIVITCA